MIHVDISLPCGARHPAPTHRPENWCGGRVPPGRLGDASGDLEPIDEHSCRLHSHVDTVEWLAFRLAVLGCEFEVHEPPELAEYLRALGARVTRAACRDPGRAGTTSGTGPSRRS